MVLAICTEAKDIVGAVDIDEHRIGSHGILVLLGGCLPISQLRQRVPGGVAPPSGIGLGVLTFVEKVVVAVQPHLTVGADIDVVSGTDPKDVVAELDVLRATTDPDRVAGRLVDRVVDGARAVAAIDDDTVVVGLQPAQMRFGSYIETGRNKAQLQQLLAQISGRHLDVRVIEGTTVAHWERIKQRESAGMQAATADVRARTAQKDARAIWNGGAEQIYEIFTGTRARARGTDLARLMGKSVVAMREVERAARQETPDDDELHSQQLNRIIDRVATYCSVPSTIVALEYLHYCEQQD